MNETIKKEVVKTFELFRGRLDDEWIDECSSLVDEGEWGIALENLCVQMFEFDVVPSVEEYEAIRKVGVTIGLSEDAWSFLAPKT